MHFFTNSSVRVWVFGTIIALALAAFALTHTVSALTVLFTACAIHVTSPAVFYVVSFVFPPLAAAHCILTGHPPTLLQALMFTPLTVFCIGVCMSVCLHRYFSHRAFETSRVAQFALALVACLAYQGGPLFWAANHKRHHKDCDNENDPHSASQQGTLYACLGWMANPCNYNIEYSILDKRVCTTEMRLLDSVYPIAPVGLCLAVKHYFGNTSMIFSCLGPMLVTRIITLVFNVEFHPETNDNASCKAYDAWRILAVVVGESKHSDHHMHPRRSRRTDLDLSWWFTLSWMQKLGIIWNLK